MLAVVVTVQVQFSVPEFTVTHFLPHIPTSTLCEQRNAQQSEKAIGCALARGSESEQWFFEPLSSFY